MSWFLLTRYKMANKMMGSSSPLSRPPQGAPIQEGTPKRLSAAAMPMNSETITPPLASRKMNMIKTVRRSGKFSRIRSDSPLPVTAPMAVVQEMCTRMGAVTGKGLSDLIRENFPLRLTVFIMFIFLLANGGVIVSEFIGIAAALNLFGVPSWIGAPCGGLLNGLLLPIILFAILYLVNKNQLMGRYTNGLIYNLVSYALAVVVSGLAVIYLVTQVLGFFGIQIFG